MRLASLTTMTAVALLAFSPAFAAGGAQDTTSGTSAQTGQTGMSNDTGTGLNDNDMSTGAANTDSWNDNTMGTNTDQQAQATQNADQTLQIAILSSTGDQPEHKTIRESNTAEGIIGKDVTSDQGNKVASIEDIIIDSGGNAQSVVLAHGGFLGLGQNRVALPYDQVVTRGAEGDALNTVSQDVLEQGRPFSYTESAQQGANTQTLASTDISVEKVLGSDVQGPNGDKVGTAENIHFQNGKAQHVLISLNDQPGTDAEEKVAMNFPELQLVRENDKYRFKLTSDQMSKIQNYQQQAGATGSTGSDQFGTMENQGSSGTAPDTTGTDTGSY